MKLVETSGLRPGNQCGCDLGTVGGSFPQPDGNCAGGAPEAPGTPSPVNSVSFSGARTAPGSPGPGCTSEGGDPAAGPSVLSQVGLSASPLLLLAPCSLLSLLHAALQKTIA